MSTQVSKFTPEKVEKLEWYQVFVFGSNQSGIHGAGAAKAARQWGAIIGKPVGEYGQTYAIPTKDNNLKTLSVDIIKRYVDEFIEHARLNEQKEYLVTEIGCGLAGYNPEDIAPLFKNVMPLYNVRLPEKFYNILKS
jgi:hypothetical protein